MNALPAVTDNAVPPYARMIPGNSAVSVPHLGNRGLHASSSGNGLKIVHGKEPSQGVSARGWISWLVPHPIADPFALYQAVLTDLLMVAATCCALAVIPQEWRVAPGLIPAYAVLVTLFSFTEGLYEPGSELVSARVIAPLGRSTFFAAALIFVASNGGMLVRAVFSTSLANFGALLLRRALNQSLDRRLARTAAKRNVLIIGAGPIGKAIARVLRTSSSDNRVVCGFLDDDLPLSPPVLGRVDDLEWLARAEFIDEVIVALPDRPDRARQAAEIALRNHLDLRAVPDLPRSCWSRAATDRIGEVPLVTLHQESLPTASLFLKRLLDLAVAAPALLLLSPFMAMIAVMVRLDSPGPVLYAAERSGAKGRRFRFFKFRSMVAGSEHIKEGLREQNQRQGPTFKIEKDPRITRVGRFLRRYSLDELPQLWNVLRGEMSVVGPRPHPIDDVNRYELHHYRRLDVKPGITGLWQITARKNPSFELNMHLDLTYIEKWSLLLDLRILARTVRVLFVPEGA